MTKPVIPERWMQTYLDMKALPAELALGGAAIMTLIKELGIAESREECDSQDGTTVGLIDALISIARVAKERLLGYDMDAIPESVLAAMDDIFANTDMRFLLSFGGNVSIDQRNSPQRCLAATTLESTVPERWQKAYEACGEKQLPDPGFQWQLKFRIAAEELGIVEAKVAELEAELCEAREATIIVRMQDNFDLTTVQAVHKLWRLKEEGWAKIAELERELAAAQEFSQCNRIAAETAEKDREAHADTIERLTRIWKDERFPAWADKMFRAALSKQESK